jgi:carboxylate-amine ligase
MYYDIPLSLGIEEEYQIIDPVSLDLTSRAKDLLELSKKKYPEMNLKPEFMQSQVESNSIICKDIHDARQEIIRLRRAVVDLANDFGLKIAAASTHPFASWRDQDISDNVRYHIIHEQLRGVIAQFLIFGFHIHVGFGENRELMIDVMNQVRYFLPHILALSTSSPFWEGSDTGLKSFRSVIFEALPRTGIPQSFRSYSEYWEYVELLGKVGSIADPSTDKPDPSKIWWDIRPSPKFNTLEFRIADIPTKIDEAVCMAAIIQALVAKLLKLRSKNESWRHYRQLHIQENKWRAMRYGIEGTLIDYGKAASVPTRDLALEIIDLLDDVVDELGSRQEVNYIHTILKEGTSAERQLAIFHRSLDQGCSEQVALKNVTENLIKETIEGADRI